MGKLAGSTPPVFGWWTNHIIEGRRHDVQVVNELDAATRGLFTCHELDFTCLRSDASKSPHDMPIMPAGFIAWPLGYWKFGCH